jgi:hypothetical protein
MLFLIYFFDILCVLYIHTYVNDLFPIRSLWTWRTQTLLRLSGSRRSFSPTPRKSFQPIGVIITRLIANGRKQGIRVPYLTANREIYMLIIKGTVYWKQRRVETGIDRSIFKNCLAGKCHFPAPNRIPSREEHQRFSAFRTFWHCTNRLGS